eukprot:TRINITY_DN64974_c0_g1_i3.p1 TRINITY_DN64974_c0_g1~~TRINITY_DN64974_c0_g1_i3.p1  ORF type:complete len:544 (-),score=46.96 TRINITY_DN64974_c0_g1_i3:6-1637(-)
MSSSNNNQRALQRVHAYATEQKMKRGSINVEFAEEQAEFSLNFDANVVLVVGGNGVGKTSLLTTLVRAKTHAVANGGPYMVPNLEWVRIQNSRKPGKHMRLLTPQDIISRMHETKALRIYDRDSNPSTWTRVHNEQVRWALDNMSRPYPSRLAELFADVFPGHVIWLHVASSWRRVVVFDDPSTSFDEVRALGSAQWAHQQEFMDERFKGLTVCSSGDTQHLKDTSGEGVRAVVALLLEMLYSNKSVLCIDELGHHLFPTQARALGRVIVRYMRERRQKQEQPLQLVVTTHSTHLQHGMCSALENDDDLHVVYITRNQDSTRSYHELTGDTLRQLRDSTKLSATPAVFDVFEHRLVVLVEGASDARLFRAAQPYATNNNNSNNNTSSTDEHKSTEIESDVMWLEVNGKGQLGAVARILRQLHVNVRIVTDFDILLPPFKSDAKSDLKKQLLVAVDDALQAGDSSISWEHGLLKEYVDKYAASGKKVIAAKDGVPDLVKLVSALGTDVSNLRPFRAPRIACKKQDTIDRHPELIKFVQSVCSSL